MEGLLGLTRGLGLNPALTCTVEGGPDGFEAWKGVTEIGALKETP